MFKDKELDKKYLALTDYIKKYIEETPNWIYYFCPRNICLEVAILLKYNFKCEVISINNIGTVKVHIHAYNDDGEECFPFKHNVFEKQEFPLAEQIADIDTFRDDVEFWANKYLESDFKNNVLDILEKKKIYINKKFNNFSSELNDIINKLNGN